MSNQKVIVSIGMPVYNEAKWISQALDSLLAQTFADFELIISDNASTDDTWEILQDYAAKDGRIILHHQSENCSALENFEYVLEQAQGEYFMWAAGHDLWSSNLLEVLGTELQANPEIVLCIPRGVLIDGTDRPIVSYDRVVDTRAAGSAAGRVLNFEQQMERSNAIYGLHRRHTLKQTFPWPKVLGSDSIALIRVAILGDIVTQPAAQWFRRENHQETNAEMAQRRLQILGVVGLCARQFPFLVKKIVITFEVSKAKGSLSDRIKLFRYTFSRLFLESGSPRQLIKELIIGSSLLIRSALLRKSTR